MPFLNIFGIIPYDIYANCQILSVNLISSFSEITFTHLIWKIEHLIQTEYT